MKIKVWYLLPVVLVMWFAIRVVSSGGGPVVVPVEEARDDASLQRARLDALVESAKENDQRSWVVFEESLDRALAEDFVNMADVNRTVESVTSMKSCAILVYLMTRDQIESTSTAGEFIGMAFAPIYAEAAARSAEIQARCLETFAKELGGTTGEFYRAAGRVVAVEQGTETVLPWDATPIVPTAGISEVASRTVIGSVFLGLDALFARETCHAARRVLEHIIQRLVVSGGVGLTAAAADGPLPVGDVLGVLICAGGTIWTLWDLYDARVSLTREIRESVAGNLSTIRRRVRETSMARALEIRQIHQQTRYEYAKKSLPPSRS
jgi:hypothetical protein